MDISDRIKKEVVMVNLSYVVFMIAILAAILNLGTSFDIET